MERSGSFENVSKSSSLNLSSLSLSRFPQPPGHQFHFDILAHRSTVDHSSTVHDVEEYLIDNKIYFESDYRLSDTAVFMVEAVSENLPIHDAVAESVERKLF